jgi:hypothetical protein
MAKKIKLEFGDVFSIPLDGNEFGFGQVMSPYNKKSGGFMIGVFNYKASIIKNLDLNKLCSSELLFLGLTFDAKIYHNDWIVIGNHINNLDSIKKPYFKIGIMPNELYMVNYKGEIIKEITEDVFNNLMYLTEIAPIRYENALKAHFGLQDWKKEDYDKLLYENSVISNEIAKSVLV